MLIQMLLIALSPNANAAWQPDFQETKRLQDQLTQYYKGNAKFEECMHTLNFPPKPLCATCFLPLDLKAAAYAEGVIAKCE